MRVAFPLIGAVVGFFVGLVTGGLAGVCVVAIALSATGHPNPSAIMDAAFASRPMGPPALVIIAIYIVTAVLGAFFLGRAARRFALRLQPLPRQDYSAGRVELLARWHGFSRVTRASLIALFILTATVSWLFSFYEQQAIAHASRLPTTERPVSINVHGDELYITEEQKRLISGGTIAMFAATSGSLGYAFYLLRISRLVGQVFRKRATDIGDA